MNWYWYPVIVFGLVWLGVVIHEVFYGHAEEVQREFNLRMERAAREAGRAE